MCGGRRVAALLGLAWAACARAPAADEVWARAQTRWERREPGAWAAWREAAARDARPGLQARLAEADALYRRGVAGLERGDVDASELLRRGAALAPIDPSLYLALARACRVRGAGVRAADFYRKLLAEAPGAIERAEAEAELAALDREIGDPFSDATIAARAAPWAAGVALAAGAAWLALRRRRVRVEALLARHPERATALVYLAGVMRHELLKHRLAPLRTAAGERAPPRDPIGPAWHRHVDAIAGALGLPAARLLREPSFRAAHQAMLAVARAERAGVAAPAAALERLAALDRTLAGWSRIVECTVVDDALLERLVESLRDEHPGRRLGVRVEVGPAPRAMVVRVLSHDLLLVLRNLTRNAIRAAEEQGAPAIRIDTALHLDATGLEWARVVVHDPSPARPPPPRPEARGLDRGLGLVRATLDRYGGALVELPPAPGFAKALAASLPCEDDVAAVDERSAAA